MLGVQTDTTVPNKEPIENLMNIWGWKSGPPPGEVQFIIWLKFSVYEYSGGIHNAALKKHCSFVIGKWSNVVNIKLIKLIPVVR